MNNTNIYDDFLKYISEIDNKVPTIIKSGLSPINYECYQHFLAQQKHIGKFLANNYNDINQKLSESICVCYERPKTHALFFDRVDYLPLPKCINGEIKYPEEIYLSIPEQCINHLQTKEELIVNFIGEFANVIPMFNHYNDTKWLKEFIEFLVFLNGEAKKYDLVGDTGDCVNSIIPNNAIKKCVDRLIETYTGTSITPIYESKNDFDNDFVSGDYEIVVATISNLNLVDENSLEWEQVLEFRQDKDCHMHYKKFLKFIKESKQNYDYDLIIYDIEKKYELYQKSLKKHGINTVIGCISDVINLKTISSTALITYITNYIDPKYVPLSIGINTGINLVIEITKKAINYEKPKADDSIAWIYDLKTIL